MVRAVATGDVAGVVTAARMIGTLDSSASAFHAVTSGAMCTAAAAMNTLTWVASA